MAFRVRYGFRAFGGAFGAFRGFLGLFWLLGGFGGLYRALWIGETRGSTCITSLHKCKQADKECTEGEGKEREFRV